MSFESDLADIIKQQFNNVGIRYEDNVDVGFLSARYFEMLTRRITPNPRTVHFSDELHDSLGNLAQEPNAKRQDNALVAWGQFFSFVTFL